MDFLPVFLDIRGRRVVVDGPGTAAARRIERALDAGAEVHAFDPEPEEEVEALEGRTRLTLHRRLPEEADIEGAVLVYGASEDPARDARLWEWTRARGILCNIADVNEMCDFITPSIVDRSPVTVAISTGGAAPVIARILRARLEATLPAAFGRLAEFAGGFRELIAAKIRDGRARRHFWERLIDGPAGDAFLAGRVDEARARVLADLEVEAAGGSGVGEVYLVGAGPGDPDLLTFRALRLMQRADVVLYDRLIGEGILGLVRRDAERIHVGKAARRHTMPQEEISRLMVRLAREGKRVLRLKGGDPFIFGRGGEEIEVLAEEGIPFQVVPGITAASGCATYAGIPLTHRDHAHSVSFVTAHGRDGLLDLDWEHLIRPDQTLAIYMGLSSLPALVEAFARRGVDRSMPVAVIEKGTRPGQRIVTGTLGDIAGKVAAEGLGSPAMIIIGTVVTLRDKLDWGGGVEGAHAMGLAAERVKEIIAPAGGKADGTTGTR
jgi:uroporphyrin-III C-methyltransferase/precorrin-2 dehydrogenase/sirohydrochlorin ferrochelatase